MARTEVVVVVGVDFGSSGDDAISYALTALAENKADKVHLLHVLDPLDVIDKRDKPALATEEEVLESAPTALVERAKEIAEARGLTFGADQVRGHARIGKAVDTLLQMCVDYEADLLCVGTHGRSGVERIMLGSVAEALVRRARCPVLIARPKDYAGLAKTPLPDPPYAPGQAPSRGSRNEDHAGIESTQMDGWQPEDNGPTGFRIV
jgi:nucleotide-binding universal stress UspA family protein